ncbi:MAG TPA: hypothetical protein VIV40_43805 [Kofleriaceae bacterium]
MKYALILLAGCSLDYEPDVGQLQPNVVDGSLDPDGSPFVPGLCGDSDPTTQVSFAMSIRPLTTRSPGGCNPCHTGNTTSGFNLGSYESLRRGGQNSGTRLIVPGKPCDSVIVQKLGLAPPFGARMPFNGPPYFSAAELTLVRDWIAEGALNN